MKAIQQIKGKRGAECRGCGFAGIRKFANFAICNSQIAGIAQIRKYPNTWVCGRRTHSTVRLDYIPDFFSQGYRVTKKQTES